MTTTIIFEDGYELDIDANLKDNHGRTAQLTKHKVEKGAEISDHITKENYTYSLDGIISEMTIEPTDGITRKASIFYEKIKNAYDENEIVKVNTSFEDYENMMITGYSIPREASQGESIFFSLQFEEVRFAETKSVKVEKVPKGSINKAGGSITANKKLKKLTSGKKSKNKLGLKLKL